jgi:O-antigen/teichoic acid export membrane protein
MIIRNILANYIGTALVGVINIVSLALYVKSLGMTSWGEVSTYLAIVNTLMVLELGISQIYITLRNKKDASADLFVRFRSALLVISLGGAGLALAGFWVASLIWSSFPVVYQKWDLLLIALTLFVVNLLNNFCYTSLTADGRQVEQNLRWVSFVFLKNSIALFFLEYVSNVPNVYFLSFLTVAVTELIVNSRSIEQRLFVGCKWGDIVLVIKQCRGLSIAIGLGIMVFNLDRLILPSLMTVESFGVYAAVVTVGLYFLPITKALFPALVKKINLNPTVSGEVMWRQVILLGGLLAPWLLLAAFFTKEILHFYSIPSVYLENAGWLFRGILFAVFLNAAYHGIYMLLVVENRDKVVALINLGAFICAILILFGFGGQSPFIAGAIAWVVVSIVQLFGGAVFYQWIKGYASK